MADGCGVAVQAVYARFALLRASPAAQGRAIILRLCGTTKVVP
jgi:hypothetical protein